MANISVKDVPDQWAEALRQRAVRNHRSLQGELMAIIEVAVHETATPVGGHGTTPSMALRGTAAGFDRLGRPIVRRGWKTVEQVAAEMRAKYPDPITDVPLGVDIIRAERDAR